MQIRNISPIRFSQSGSTCVFQIDYSAVFSQGEVASHFTFADSVRVMEDDTSDDDIVQNWLREESWTPTDTQDDWTWTVRVNEDDVDTELGGEEIYLQIRLRNVTTSSPSIFASTGIIQVSPG
ncbi:hypothetical protein [Pseudonocardia sp. TRM90224]|uniref:hypothetical protein n=1 Tax=Pseudonocardia sp. TRM90224 TaxID=2812678 RepID=UPI001E5BC47C|nr:hypothetical protein [Pseudonocardia sp. TRM90224]